MSEKGEFESEDHRRRYEAEFADLIQKCTYMFTSEVPFFRLAIREGWKPIFRELCAAIDRELTTEEKTLFHWRQVKQKFGGLRAYWGLRGRGLRLWADLQIRGHGVLTLPPQTTHDLERRITRLVDAAMNEAQGTCEKCGATPAKFDDTGRYRMTLCDRHIAQRRQGEEDGDA